MKRNSLMAQLPALMTAMTLASALVLGACVVDAPESDEVTEETLERAEAAPSAELLQATEDELQPEALCPRKWTCNFVNYYSTRSQCLTACGGAPCYRDYDCRGTCVCP